MGLEQVVQPSCPSSFFKGHRQASAQPLNELQNRCRFCLEDRFHYQLAARVHNGNRDGVFVNVHADVLAVIHGMRVLLSVECRINPRSYVKGRPSIMRWGGLKTEPERLQREPWYRFVAWIDSIKAKWRSSSSACGSTPPKTLDNADVVRDGRITLEPLTLEPYRKCPGVKEAKRSDSA